MKGLVIRQRPVTSSVKTHETERIEECEIQKYHGGLSDEEESKQEEEHCEIDEEGVEGDGEVVEEGVLIVISFY
jgi:hypothetical protein